MAAIKLFIATLCITFSNGFITAPTRHALRQSPLYEESSGETAEPSTEPTNNGGEESDILNSAAFLQRKVEVLQGDLKKLDESMEEVNAVYEANKAEWGEKFDKLNDESRLMQERFSKQSVDTTAEATVDVIKQMLNVIDTYERAFNAVEPSTSEQEGIVSEYKDTYDKILSCFAELNVTKIETVGSEFDYELHQAMMQMPSEDHEEGIVCQEFAPGWICGDRLIRPAMVAVAA
eukprot:scaffold41156_cov78-Cyclotella_meneghiniana.AAC.1